MEKFRAVQFHPDYCKEARDAPLEQWDSSHDLSIIKDDGSRVRVGTFKHAEWAERVGVLLERHGFHD